MRIVGHERPGLISVPRAGAILPWAVVGMATRHTVAPKPLLIKSGSRAEFARVEQHWLQLSRRLDQRSLARPSGLSRRCVESECRCDDDGAGCPGEPGSTRSTVRIDRARTRSLSNRYSSAQPVASPHQQLVTAVTTKISRKQCTGIITGHFPKHTLLAMRRQGPRSGTHGQFL